MTHTLKHCCLFVRTLKYSYLCVSLLICGCAETRLYDNGQLVACIQADCINVNVVTPHMNFHADTLNHSTATAAAYTGTAAVVGAAASGVAAGLLAHP